jgi:hypothetical protein
MSMVNTLNLERGVSGVAPPGEPALLASAGMDAGAPAASRERSP